MGKMLCKCIIMVAMKHCCLVALLVFVATKELSGSELEKLAGELGNVSLTQILGRRPFLDNRDNADYTDYVAEDYFWRLISAAPNYYFFVFSVIFHKNWAGWYMTKQFRPDRTDIFGHHGFQDKHYKATAVAFGSLRQ
eukprot:TRINITY_DN10001_c0_g1_i1.p2 TRINITY_DN10001_c0_g1~~TRINITY_DN10001_c0_g1_i1.p2  ORF type:complete len:138 (-),score=19.77 TRINITY_DN10001_c0_g1_i1:500-913(-)